MTLEPTDDAAMKRGLAIVTPVRDRFEHLLATLPGWCAQPCVDEVVICDFGSAPPIGDDVIALSPKIRIVRCGEDEPWNKGLAQNIGVLASGCDIILKSDCDIHYADLSAYRRSVEAGGFVSGYLPWRDNDVDMSKRGCIGQVMFRRSDWERIGGYHEFFHGWGFDDQDFYNRLEDAGVEHRFFDLDDLTDIPHDDTMRGGARLPDDQALPIPEEIRTKKQFQNTRNKLLAGMIPWEAGMGRSRTIDRLGPQRFVCALGARSKLETRSQMVAAFLASRYWDRSNHIEVLLRRRLIDERLGRYDMMARRSRGEAG